MRRLRFLVFILSTALLAAAGIAVAAALPEELDKKIFLVLKTEKTEAYLKEKIALTVALSHAGLAVRDIHYPALGESSAPVGEWKGPFSKLETREDAPLNVLEFKTFAVPDKIGALRVGPATLNCTVLFKSQTGTDAFFGAQKEYELALTTEAALIKILPLPKEGRPDRFQGAVGSFDLSVQVQPRTLSVGDPVTVTTTVTGDGNYSDVNCSDVTPATEKDDPFKRYPPRRDERNDSLICEQVLVPDSASATAVPPVRFSFFNPGTKRYAAITKGPFLLTVTGSPVLHAPAPEISPRAARSASQKNRVKITLAALLCLAFLSLLFKEQKAICGLIKKNQRRRRNRFRWKKSIKKAEQTIVGGDSAQCYTLLFRTLQEWLADASGLPQAGITVDIIENVLKPRGADEAALETIQAIFYACDTARYSPRPASRQEMTQTVRMLQKLIASSFPGDRTFSGKSG